MLGDDEARDLGVVVDSAPRPGFAISENSGAPVRFTATQPRQRARAVLSSWFTHRDMTDRSVSITTTIALSMSSSSIRSTKSAPGPIWNRSRNTSNRWATSTMAIRSATSRPSTWEWLTKILRSSPLSNISSTTSPATSFAAPLQLSACR